jgi:hypothetical protein
LGVAGGIKRGVSITYSAARESVWKGRGNYAQILRYKAVSMLAMVAGAVMAAIGIAFVLVFLREPVGALGAFALSALLGGACIIIGNSYSNAANFAGMQYAYSGERVGYFTRENLWVAFKWALFKAAVVAAVALPVGIVLGIAASRMGVESLLGTVPLAALVVSAPLALAMYYLNQEFAMKKAGPAETIISSLRLVGRNFWETLVAASATGIGAQAVYSVSIGAFYAGVGVSIALMLAGGESYVMGAALAIFCIVAIVVVMVVIESGMLLMQVGVYKGVGGGKSGSVRGTGTPVMGANGYKRGFAKRARRTRGV